MTPTTASTVADRPAAQVFAYATDPARFHEWQQGVTDGHLDQPGPPRVGTKCLTTRRIGGANRATTSELTHIDPPRTWGVQGIDGPIRATVYVTVEPLTETSSRLTIAVDFDGHGIGKTARPAFAFAARHTRKCPSMLKPKRLVEAQRPHPAEGQALGGARLAVRKNAPAAPSPGPSTPEPARFTPKVLP